MASKRTGGQSGRAGDAGPPKRRRGEAKELFAKLNEETRAQAIENTQIFEDSEYVFRV